MKIRSKTVRYGRNRDDEDSYVRCSRCGFICNLDRDIRKSDGDKSGFGINNTAIQIAKYLYDSDIIYDIDDDYDAINRTIYDPIVTSGCPQCGCLLY